MKEKIKIIYSVLGIVFLILLIIVVVIWIFKQIKINWDAISFDEINCKKNLVQNNFDSNMYLKDLYSETMFSLSDKFRAEIGRETLAVLLNKDENDIENMAKDEHFRLSNKAGWEQTAVKIKDLIGTSVNLESLDYKNPNFLSEFCECPKFIQLK